MSPTIKISDYVRSLALAALMVAGLVQPLVADESYLPPHHPDGILLLAPPPLPDSAEQAADIASARAVFHARTPEELKRAEKDSALSISNFAPAIGEDFKRGRYPKVDLLFDHVKTNISETIDWPKNHWKRKRPYQVDPTLELGKPESSYSYPSGHSTRGTVQALFLSEIFPEKREAILQIGREIGWDRVLIGKHFPTDVQAGRVLGQAIFHELMKSEGFQRDLAAAKAEVEAEKK